MLFEAAKDGGAFVDDPGVDPGWGEATEVGTLTALVYAIFFALFVGEDSEPAGIDFFKDGFYFQQAVFVDGAIELENAVDSELCAYRSFELEEGGARWEDVGRARDNVGGEVSAGDSSEDDCCEGFLGPLCRPVEDQVDTLEEFQRCRRKAYTRPSDSKDLLNKIGIPIGTKSV